MSLRVLCAAAVLVLALRADAQQCLQQIQCPVGGTVRFSDNVELYGYGGDTNNAYSPLVRFDFEAQFPIGSASFYAPIDLYKFGMDLVGATNTVGTTLGGLLPGNVYLDLSNTHADGQLGVRAEGNLISSNGIVLGRASQPNIAPAQITSNQNNYVPANCRANIWFLSSDAARSLTGLGVSETSGTHTLDCTNGPKYLHNEGAFSITLEHQDAGSSAENRFNFSATGADYVLGPGQTVALYYRSLRWVQLTSFTLLPTDVTGIEAAPGDDYVLVSDGAGGSTWRQLPDCDAEGGTLNYDQATNTFSCLTDGGGGGGNSVEVSLALSGGSGFFSTTVTGQTWVAADSEIVCNPFGTTADGLTPEAVAVAGLGVSIANRVAATGFDVQVFSPYGLDGTVRIHCLGV